MPGLSSLARVRTLPWAIALEAAVVATRHWRELSEPERRRVLELVRTSGGRPGNLSERQRAELRRLLAKLDLTGMGREMLPFAGRWRRRG